MSKNVKIVLLVVLTLGLVACGPSGLYVTKAAQGEVGPQGPAGAAGLNGSNGSGCSVSTVAASTDVPNGGSLITCGDGSSSLVLNGEKGDTGATGSTGATGATGAAGHNGNNGNNGNNGSVLTPVKFCGADTSYPNTFTELGFCLNNKMYGVYSLNGGFLAELPPGTYTSNGVNSSCTFTIGNNCSVSR